jgi:hypothetical protein
LRHREPIFARFWVILLASQSLVEVETLIPAWKVSHRWIAEVSGVVEWYEFKARSPGAGFFLVEITSTGASRLYGADTPA